MENHKFTVMLDCDGLKSAELKSRLALFKNLLEKMWPGRNFRVYRKPSPSKTGWHIWAVPIGEVMLLKRDILLVQCLAGSDIKRERCNFDRICAGQEDWNILFATKRLPLKGLGKSEKRA